MHIFLDNAYFCQNCETVGDDPHCCESCADETSIIKLADWLNRTRTEEPCTKPSDKQTPKQS